VPGRSVGSEVALEVAADPRRVVGRQSVDLVENDDLAVETRDPPSEEVVVEHGIVILLGVGHPDDGVGAREDGFDALAVLPLDRIEVGQIEDRDVAQRRLVVLADVGRVDVQPVEQVGDAVAPCAGPTRPASMSSGGELIPRSPASRRAR
jgi:hypothetical protein